MTITDESVDVSAQTETTESTESGKKGRKRDLDFTKFSENHSDFAAYVNERSGLDPVTPNHIKAVLALRTDFNDTPEQKTKRDEAKKRREEAKKKYEGMSEEEIARAKAAEKADRQVERMEKRIADARAHAEALRNGQTANGADLASAVTAAQSDSESEPVESGKRRFGRSR